MHVTKDLRKDSSEMEKEGEQYTWKTEHEPKAEGSYYQLVKAGNRLAASLNLQKGHNPVSSFGPRNLFGNPDSRNLENKFVFFEAITCVITCYRVSEKLW